MSLNWKEIDTIISEWNIEGGKIQKVLQPHFNSLFLEIYNHTAVVQKHSVISIVLENNAVRIHTSTHKIAKPKTPQRFQQLLQSRITGSTISKIQHVNQERVICFTLTKHTQETPSSNHSAPLLLYVRLWSNQANILLCNEDNTIIDLAFRRPKQELIPGKTFAIPPRSSHEKKSPLVVREKDDKDMSFNQYIESFYTERHTHIAQEQMLKKITTALNKRIESHTNTHRHITRQLAEYKEYHTLEHYGNIILAHVSSISPQSKELIVETTEDNAVSRTLIISLNPSLTAIENAEYYFNQAKKIKKRYLSITRTARTLEQETPLIQKIQTMLSQKNMHLSEKEKQWLFPHSKQDIQKQNTQSSKKPPIKMVFQDPPYLIMVGRNVKENDTLLRHYVKGNDIWLHSRGYSGAYVFIRSHKNKTIPLDMLIRGAQIAALYSKAKNEAHIDVFYTETKYLKRVKKTPGLVVPIRSKNIQIKVDSEQIKQYLAKFNL